MLDQHITSDGFKYSLTYVMIAAILIVASRVGVTEQLSTKQSALERAYAVLSFGSAVNETLSMVDSIANITNGPALTLYPGIAIGDTLWEVSVTKFPLFNDITDKDRGTITYRDLKFVFDQKSGKLVQFTSVFSMSAGVDSMKVLMSKSDELLSKGINFGGYPDSIAVGIIQALSNCPFGPKHADLISARYVFDSNSTVSGEPRPVWIISLVGIEPLELTHANVTNDQRTRITNMRIVIDGFTGKPLRASN
ncbi:MAG: hypothetical protein AAB305_06035 [Candidatus Zixiibacteriota bacterium]